MVSGPDLFLVGFPEGGIWQQYDDWSAEKDHALAYIWL